MADIDQLIDDFWIEDDDDAAFVAAGHSIAARLAEADGLKTFPGVAHQALEILNTPDYRVVDLVAAIQGDPSLAAAVLRAANKDSESNGGSVLSINSAMIRLGSRGVHDIISAAAAMDLFSDTGGLGRRVRDHCASTAAIAGLLSREFARAHTEKVFVAALFHDIGKMLLIESREIDVAGGAYENATRSDRTHKEERALLGYDHAVLGSHVLAHWRIPSPIPKIVAWHHSPARAYEHPEIGPAVAVLRLADQIDAVLRSRPRDLEKQLNQLASGLDCDYMGITAAHLNENIAQLREARRNALRRFSGA